MLHVRKTTSLALALIMAGTSTLSLQLYSTPKKPKLSDFARNDFSQWGEDGIIEKIFQIIGTTSKVAIEFGANDGFYFSNTANLWKKHNWKAILIEGNKKHFNTLLQNTHSFDCLPICEYVGIKESSLETILKRYGVNEQIDLLSFDIDGNDYYVLQSLKTLRPRVIIIEHNPTLPATLDLYQPYDSASLCRGFGCSVGALNRIAESKGYKLVCITLTNSIFVLEKLFDLFEEFETSLREIQVEDHIKYVVTTYRGDYAVVGRDKVIPYGITNPASPGMLLGSAHTLKKSLKIK